MAMVVHFKSDLEVSMRRRRLTPGGKSPPKKTKPAVPCRTGSVWHDPLVTSWIETEQEQIKKVTLGKTRRCLAKKGIVLSSLELSRDDLLDAISDALPSLSKRNKRFADVTQFVNWVAQKASWNLITVLRRRRVHRALPLVCQDRDDGLSVKERSIEDYRLVAQSSCEAYEALEAAIDLLPNDERRLFEPMLDPTFGTKYRTVTEFANTLGLTIQRYCQLQADVREKLRVSLLRMGVDYGDVLRITRHDIFALAKAMRSMRTNRTSKDK